MNEEEVFRAIQKHATVDQTRIFTNILPSMEMHTFLRAFELSCGHGNDDCVRLKASLPPAEHKILSGWIFGTSFSRNIGLVEELVLVLKESLIAAQDLILLLVSYCLNLNSPPLPKMLHFHKLLRALCTFSDLSALDAPASETSPTADNPFSSWWQNIHDLLTKSCDLEYACSAALVCRSVMAEFEKNKINEVD